MRKIKLTVSYDGTNYHGFQRQKSLITVQQVLEENLAGIFGDSVNITPSGRTDARVHALGQVVSFATEGKIPADRIVPAARAVLPPSVAVLEAQDMPQDFHARYEAKAKQYIYKIKKSSLPDPFWTNYAWIMDNHLDIETMNKAACMITGEHDFSSFRASGSTPTHPVREIYEAFWQRENDIITFTIKGSGFLYHMVRNLVGSFIDVGTGKTSIEGFAGILAAKDRTVAGKTAPPQGLYLDKVFY